MWMIDCYGNVKSSLLVDAGENECNRRTKPTIHMHDWETLDQRQDVMIRSVCRAPPQSKCKIGLPAGKTE